MTAKTDAYVQRVNEIKKFMANTIDPLLSELIDEDGVLDEQYDDLRAELDNLVDLVNDVRDFINNE